MYFVRSVAQRVRISSMVLFLRRDWATGRGPVVEAERPVALVVAGVWVAGAWDGGKLKEGADEVAPAVAVAVAVVPGADADADDTGLALNSGLLGAAEEEVKFKPRLAGLV